MNIAVIFGGESCEHDISILTGVQLMLHCDEYIYNIFPVYIDKNGKWRTGDSLKDLDNYSSNHKKLKECCFIPGCDFLYIKKGKKYIKFLKIDCSILCLHGLRGEDGSVASIMELSKIPYANSSICASSICLDKCLFKKVASSLCCNVIDSVCINSNEFSYDYSMVETKIEKLGFPCIIKPARLGSSIGIVVCENKENLYDSLKNAFIYDDKLLIEMFVDIKKEVNIALFSNKGEIVFSQTEEPVSSDKILSFENKYLKNPGGFETIKRIVPADISPIQNEQVNTMARVLYKELGMSGVVRFDFIIDKDDSVFINEVNTIPGSMANYLFDKKEYSYSNLIDCWIKDAIWRKGKADKLLKVFDSSVLSSGNIGLKK
ncbi:MAG: D-alanine--D-alanine ligase [Clostridia bacterium]|nr:D-alanine--D-alanine ligase [Clostridia bacterium]